jgi:hypothetical protein
MGDHQRTTTRPLKPIERKPDMRTRDAWLLFFGIALVVCLLCWLTRNL